MKTYNTAGTLENALRGKELFIELVVGPQGNYIYFLGTVEGTNDKIIRVKVA